MEGRELAQRIEHLVCEGLVEEVGAPRVTELQQVPDALTFARDFVAMSRALVIRSSAVWQGPEWSTVKEWSDDGSADPLVRIMEQRHVSVSVSPDGWNDAVVPRDGDAVFAEPDSLRMPFDEVRYVHRLNVRIRCWIGG